MSKFFKVEDERALIAACIQSINNWYIVMSKLKTSDFLAKDHCVLLELISSLFRANYSGLTFEVLISAAKDAGVDDNIGGPDYVSTLCKMSLLEINLEYHLDRIVKATEKLNYESVLANSNRVLIEDKTDIDDLRNKAVTDILDLSLRARGMDDGKLLSDGTDTFLPELDIPKQLLGLQTGFNNYDVITDGLVPGELMVIAARMKAGKSAFLSNIANHVGNNLNTPVLYIDTEMRTSEWVSRMYAIDSGVSHSKIQHGKVSKVERNLLVTTNDKFKKSVIIHKTLTGFNIEKLTAICYKYKKMHDLGLIVFDYVKAPPGSINNVAKEHQIIGDITTQLKDIAEDLDLPILTAAQLNRQHDIADSDKIARYANVIAIWSKRSDEELDHAGADSWKTIGTHKLMIQYSRNSNKTGDGGIGFNFTGYNFNIKESSDQSFLNDDWLNNKLT